MIAPPHVDVATRADRVRRRPYPGSPFSQTHPDRLATTARSVRTRGGSPERCRVLELGCGDGGNLIPMAYVLPESTFLGLDAAGSAIAQGKEQIAALGLTNVTLLHADLLEASNLGTFDYVIAHGLYSWVPPPVQERILAIASEALAPNGVAYVSYNALPGCHVRNAMREMMRWHVRGIEDPAERISQARGLVRFLGEAAPPRPLFSAILNDTLEHQEKQPDAVLFHDDLADFNEPLLFVDFIARASRAQAQVPLGSRLLRHGRVERGQPRRQVPARNGAGERGRAAAVPGFPHLPALPPDAPLPRRCLHREGARPRDPPIPLR